MGIPHRETLTVEFKSDRERLSDKVLVEAVVGLANAEGGEIWLGVEDNGIPTGLHAAHTQIESLAVLIANRTQPPVCVKVELYDESGQSVARIVVPKSRHSLTCTTDGRYLRRRLLADGTAECAPMYGYALMQRQTMLGQLDLSGQLVPEATLDDLDPLERVRLRRVIEQYAGDRSLLPLADEELDGALGLTASSSEGRRPTLAGFLLLGKQERFRQLVPTHEVAFQVLDGTDVRTNDFFRVPLLRVLEEIEARFSALQAVWGEDEFEDGLFRISIQRYDPRAFREAFMNAIVHRDYALLGAVHVRFDEDGLSISNAGGFVEGVTLENLLTVEPRPRNPLLADVMKRLGLVERTGRGVDRIFEGMIRYGRPEPDYSRSNSSSVILRLAHAEYDAEFLRMVVREEQRLGKPLPIDSLILLSRLRRERRISVADLMEGPFTAQFHSRGTLERLAEADLIEAHGSGRGRAFTLSARVYRAIGEHAEYVRQAGFDTIQQEQMVLKYVEAHGTIRRGDVMELCRLTKDQAAKVLKRLVSEGKLAMRGTKRGAYYERRQKL